MIEGLEKVDKLIEEYTDFQEISNSGGNLCIEENDVENETNKMIEVEENLSVQDEMIGDDSQQEEIKDEDKIHDIKSEIKNETNNKRINRLKLKKELRKKYEENIKKIFYKQTDDVNNLPNIGEEINNNDNSNNHEEGDVIENPSNTETLFAFSKLKKLKKKSDIIKQKEISKKVSFRNFFEVEAELGSDNEEHDDVVKNIKDDEVEEDNEDEDLKDLICDNLEEFSDEETKGKFFSDMLLRDREELKKVIEGPKRRMLNHKRSRGEDDDLSEDNLPLHLRIKQNKSDNPGTSDFNQLLKNFNSFEQTLLDTEENQENDEFKDMMQSYQNNLIKKLGEKSKDHKTNLLNRMKENDKILENVINLNSMHVSSINDKDKNKNKQLFITGTNASLSNVSNSHAVGNVNSQNILTGSSRMKMGFLHSKNSFLHAMKNDKYYNKHSNEEGSLISGGDGNMFRKNSSTDSNNLSAASNKPSAVPFFMQSSNQKASMISNNKSANLSCLFTRSSKQRHNVEPQIKKMRTPNKNDGNVFHLKKLLH